MQAIVIHNRGLVYPQSATIVRNKGETVRPTPSDDNGACPAHAKVILARETWPCICGLVVIHNLDNPLHICQTAIETSKTATLAKIEAFFEKTI
jgi:hypothetical protein